jgi:hypothetical protein
MPTNHLLSNPAIETSISRCAVRSAARQSPAQGKKCEEQTAEIVGLVRDIQVSLFYIQRACNTFSADISRVNLSFLSLVSSGYSPAVPLITKVTVPIEFHSDMPLWIGNT